MPIVSEISDAVEERNLIPPWRGGNLVPAILRKYEQAPAVNPDEPSTKDLKCNYGVQPDGGLVDGIEVENTVYNRNEDVDEVTVEQPEVIVIPDDNSFIIADETVNFYSEDTIDDNFTF